MGISTLGKKGTLRYLPPVALGMSTLGEKSTPCRRFCRWGFSTPEKNEPFFLATSWRSVRKQRNPFLVLIQLGKHSAKGKICFRSLRLRVED
jgi:hypothetical protein